MPVNKKLNFRVEVRAGTGKVSTADSQPSRDWERAGESSKQTLSTLPVQQPQSFPWERGEWLCCRREKITARVRTQAFLPGRAQELSDSSQSLFLLVYRIKYQMSILSSYSSTCSN